MRLQMHWARRGMKVTVVHLLETLMERQLDDAAATARLERRLEERGGSWSSIGCLRLRRVS